MLMSSGNTLRGLFLCSMIYINEPNKAVFSIGLCRSSESFNGDLRLDLKNTVTQESFTLEVQTKAVYNSSLLLEADFKGIPIGEYEYDLTSEGSSTSGLLQIGSYSRPKTAKHNKEYKCYGN